MPYCKLYSAMCSTRIFRARLALCYCPSLFENKFDSHAGLGGSGTVRYNRKWKRVFCLIFHTEKVTVGQVVEERQCSCRNSIPSYSLSNLSPVESFVRVPVVFWASAVEFSNIFYASNSLCHKWNELSSILPHVHFSYWRSVTRKLDEVTTPVFLKQIWMTLRKGRWFYMWAVVQHCWPVHFRVQDNDFFGATVSKLERWSKIQAPTV